MSQQFGRASTQFKWLSSLIDARREKQIVLYSSEQLALTCKFWVLHFKKELKDCGCVTYRTANLGECGLWFSQGLSHRKARNLSLCIPWGQNWDPLPRSDPSFLPYLIPLPQTLCWGPGEDFFFLKSRNKQSNSNILYIAGIIKLLLGRPNLKARVSSALKFGI